MKFRCIVRFSGLCAFVPRLKGYKAWVLLINGEKTFKGRKTDVPPHKSVIRYNIRHLHDLRDDKYFPVDDSFGLWYMNEYDIRIWPGGVQPTTADLKFTDFDPSAPPSKAPSSKSFYWVAPIEDACDKRGFPDCGKIYPELLEEPISEDFVDVTLAARIHLETGVLATEQISTFNKSKVVWRFRPFKGEERGNDHRQLLASEVSLTIDTDEDFIDFVAIGLNDVDQEVVERLRLAPTQEELDNSTPKDPAIVDVNILNEEGEEIAQIEREVVIEPKKERVQDRIFEDFLILTPNAPAAPDIPMPVADHFLGSKAGEGIALGSPPCSPGRTAAADVEIRLNVETISND